MPRQGIISRKVGKHQIVAERRAIEWPMAACAAALTLLFLWPYWNRFVGASSNGWHGYYGHLILQGKVPYRDFHLYVPPLFPLELGALEWLFGTSLLPLRLFGVIERILIAALLTAWLRRVFSTWIALIGGVVAAVAFCGDPADALTLHHHGSLLWIVAAGLCTSFMLLAADERKRRKWAFLCGLMAATSLLAKHTTGIIAGFTLMGMSVYMAGALHGRKIALRSATWMMMGWVCPVLAVLSWLWWNKALPDFLVQVVIEGPSSKGPIWEVFARPIAGALTNSGRLVLALGAIILHAGLFTVPRREEPGWGGKNGDRWGVFLRAGMLLVVSISLPQAYVLIGEPSITPWVLRSVQLGGVYFGFIGCAIILGRCTRRMHSEGVDAGSAQLWIISGTSLAAAYSLSLSWPVYEVMAMPSLGLTVGWYLSAFETNREDAVDGRTADISWARAGRVVVLAVAGGLLATTAMLKVVEPFSWEDWKEPGVWSATRQSRLRELRGFRLAPGTMEFLEINSEAIRQHSQPGEQVFVFPHLPVLYTLSGREAALLGAVHWFDVAPDAFARREAELLRKVRPRVIGYLDLGEEATRKQEAFYRGGEVSGQRDLLKAIHELTTDYETLKITRPPGSSTDFKLVVAKPRKANSEHK